MFKRDYNRALNKERFLFDRRDQLAIIRMAHMVCFLLSSDLPGFQWYAHQCIRWQKFTVLNRRFNSGLRRREREGRSVVLLDTVSSVLY